VFLCVFVWCCVLQYVAMSSISRAETQRSDHVCGGFAMNAAVCCSVLQCVAVCCSGCYITSREAGTHQEESIARVGTAIESLQHAATYCNTLQHTANTLQYTETHQQRSITHAGTARGDATHCTTHCNTRCHTLQHAATHCNTLHHTTIYCNKPARKHRARRNSSRKCNSMHPSL